MRVIHAELFQPSCNSGMLFISAQFNVWLRQIICWDSTRKDLTSTTHTDALCELNEKSGGWGRWGDFIPGKYLTISGFVPGREDAVPILAYEVRQRAVANGARVAAGTWNTFEAWNYRIQTNACKTVKCWWVSNTTVSIRGYKQRAGTIVKTSQPRVGVGHLKISLGVIELLVVLPLSLSPSLKRCIQTVLNASNIEEKRTLQPKSYHTHRAL